MVSTLPGARFGAALLTCALFALGHGCADEPPMMMDARDPVRTADAGGEAAISEDAGSSAKPEMDASDAGREDAGSTRPNMSRDSGQRPMPSYDAGRMRDAGDAGEQSARDASAPPSDAARPTQGAKFVGNITTSGQVRADFAMYWNQITPENEGKWGSVEATRNQMNWSGLDRVHNYAKQNGVRFKQHTFVWGSQQPSWLAGLAPAQQKAEVEEWIRLFCERYPDVELIDVVNEPPPHTMPVYMEALGGAGASGYDWIVQAFKWARQYCPKATLLLNDYNNIEYSADNMRTIAIVNAIKAAGAPIDAVGAQAHDAYKLSTASVQQLIDKLASGTGLPVYITEYDINLADDAQQQQVMQSQFTMFWNDANVKGITLWGYIVGATWRDNTGLMSASGEKRPALSWLESFLKR